MITWPWTGTMPNGDAIGSFTVPGHDIKGEANAEGLVTLTCECGFAICTNEPPQLGAEAALLHLGTVDR